MLTEIELKKIKDEANALYPDHNLTANPIIYGKRIGYYAGVTLYAERSKILLEALQECKDYFMDKADADYEGESYVPNKEMRIAVSIDKAIEEFNKTK